MYLGFDDKDLKEYVQVCHSSDVDDDDKQDISVVFRLNEHAMMIYDYTLNYAARDKKEVRGLLLRGKKYLLSKSEISKKWKVAPIFKSNKSTKACGIKISHNVILEEKFGQENKEKEWTPIIDIPKFQDKDFFSDSNSKIG